MIVNNGEILAIDHIAHDNTLSGNGTSAKPVGLSQSTNDLIDSKVKKTDFETYKSSAANQISNINTKITIDESNFESYKSSAANQINTINNKIAADEADFNSYKSSAHNEIARVDEKIDTTSDNLRDNYYKTSETYNRTEVDEKFANFGGFKFRDPDPTKDNEPKLAPGEVVDPKAIYLTQPAGATQYLQWIWNTEVIPNVWKCIGNTTMDLSDYAKTVDVVQSANNNVQAVKAWADDKFETKQDFESVIAGYYTKDEVNTELDTKVNNADFNTYKTEVDGKLTNTSAWANNTFATKTDLNDVQTDLETEISNLSTNIESDLADVSGKIINELNDVESALDNKINNVDTKLDTVSSELVGKIKTVEEILSANIDAVDEKVDDLKTELERDYYDAVTIEDILAASGDYYDKDEIKSLLNDYVKTENLEPINEKIDSVSAEFNKYYTKTDVNVKFTTKDTFDTTIADINNDLDDIAETVSTIDQNVASLSTEIDKKFNTVIETSDTVIATSAKNSDGTISYSLSAIGGGGSQSNYLWKPTVDESGNIEWTISVTTDTPASANIKGPQGPQGIQGVSGTPGKNGENGITPHIGDNNHWFIGDYDTGVSATGPQGPEGPQGPKGDTGEPGTNGIDGKDGKDGTNGKDGVSPTVSSEQVFGGTEVTFTYGTGQTETITVLDGTPGAAGVSGYSPTVSTEAVTAEGHPQGGTKVTITDLEHQSGQEFYVWNGTNGQGATVNLLDGDGIHITNDGTNYTIGVSANYSAMAVSWVQDQHYLTDIPNGYALKTDVEAASANAYNEAVAQIPNVDNFITKDVNNLTYYYKKTETSSTSEITNALSTKLDSTVAGQTYQPKGNYATISDISDMATKRWVGQQGFLTNTDLTDYATKTYANEASANALSKAEAWVKEQSYLTQNDIAGKADKTELETVSGEIVDMIPSLNGYATEQYVQGASAEVTAWVNDHHYLVADDIAGKADKADLQYVSAGVDYVSGHIPTKVTDLTDSANYYTINQTSAANELTTEFAKYALLANVPTKVTDLTDSADYAKKTDLEGFVTSSNISTPDIDYVMTTTGWKVLTLPGGGMTQVIHDTTLSGQGNADDNKLGVAWSALSGYTITSALSAGSATVAANLGTSSFADITSAINAKADATAISDMLTKTEAEQTYQTKAGMSDYLTTSDASTTYQPKGNYATISDISDMATKTWVGQRGYLTQSDLASYATETYVDTASAAALSQAKTWVNQQNFATSAGLAANTRYEMTNTGWTSAIKIQVDTQVPTTDDGILHIILES